MKDDLLNDIQYVLDNMKKTLLKVYHLKEFDIMYYCFSSSMPLRFKMDCEYKNNFFKFDFVIFDYEYSSKIILEKLIEEKTNRLLKTLIKLTKEKHYISLYGEDFKHTIEKRWLNRRLNRKLLPKLKKKVIKI